MMILNVFNILTENIDFRPNTKKYQAHVVCSRDYKLISVDE